MARDDYEVFYLRPGACAADVRKRYKDMAVALHPDRCRVRITSAWSHPTLAPSFNYILVSDVAIMLGAV